jgi:predicted RNase H-like HicB family nuclease
MEQTRRLTAIIEREDDGFVALCPEVDVASQGSTIEEARAKEESKLKVVTTIREEMNMAKKMWPS